MANIITPDVAMPRIMNAIGDLLSFTPVMTEAGLVSVIVAREFAVIVPVCAS
jgi:hypothetical protein